MKKILGAVACVALLGCFISCESTKAGGNGGSQYTIQDGDEVIGYFQFEEDDIDNNEVKDYSGYGLYVENASLDDPMYVEGVHGSALYFNGEDEYLQVDPEVVDGDALTIAAWIKPDGAWPIWARFFDFGDTMKDIFVAADGRQPGTLVFYEQETAASCNCPIPPAGKWVHVAATLGGGKIALYVNGKLSQELPCSVTTEDLSMENNLACWIGRSNWPDPLFRGAMDDLLIARRKFSASEIKAVYGGVIAPSESADVEADAE